MGVAPYKTFTFDGVSSSVYGVYLTGEGVFNAPQRAVEMIEIPGRNGNYALDQGKFNNISVTYKVGMFDVDESNFATKVSNFRNWLCSKVGYKRLMDEYNANEYRMAVYASGFELDHDLLIAGEAEITFDCKPQRFLTSGETATAVANNGTISNPTLFDASPTLEFQGYGNISLAGQPINVSLVSIGQVLLANQKYITVGYPYDPHSQSGTSTVATHKFDANVLNTSDTITLQPSTYTYSWSTTEYDETVTVATATSQSGSDASTTAIIRGDKTADFTTMFKPLTFTKGTSATKTHTYDLTVRFERSANSYVDVYRTISISIAYNGSDTITMTASNDSYAGGEFLSGSGIFGEADGFSTVTASGTITIDLEAGDAYFVKNGTNINANYAVKLGTTLPVLKPGSNTITYPNTITNFKIIPNWWKV